MSCSRRSRFYVALVVVSLIGLLVPAGLLWAAVTAVSRPGLQQVDTAPKKPAAPGPMFMLPIPGLTTVSHPAPASTAIPLGTRLMLKQPASSGAVVQWWGATEVARDDTGSTAKCSLNTLGWSHVAVEIAYPGGMVGEQALDLNVIDIDVADIQVGPINVLAGPLPLDENLTNKQTMAYYFAGSVATVVEIGEGHYRTSVDRPLPLSVVVDPPGLAPLIEWRIDGAARHLGTALEDYRQQEIGTYVVSVGPPDREQSVQFDMYSVEIISHTNIVDILPEGVPITFEAVTHPPGFEDDITWLSSTKYGTAAPVVGHGPTFTAEFNDTIGPDDGRQWLGVIADNARFGQDQKIPQDPTDYDFDRPFVAEFYQSDPQGYWALHGFPALSRLSNQLEDLAINPLGAFDGISSAFDEPSFLGALETGDLPQDFIGQVNAFLDLGLSTLEALLESIRLFVRELDSLDPVEDAQRISEIHQTFATVFKVAFTPSEIETLAPEAQKEFSTDPPPNGGNSYDRHEFDSFSRDLDTPTPGPDDNDTSTERKWTEITTVHWKTTYNASCVAQAVGPSAAKLGILKEKMTCKDWNDLSRKLGADEGEAGASQSDVAAWYRGHGYGCSRAWDGLFESACEEAKKALDRGCDVVMRYRSPDDTKGHQEMVTGITVDSSDDEKCTVTTLSWGQAATVTYDSGNYSDKSDGMRYRQEGEDKSYLERDGSAFLLYYCKK